MDKDHNNSMLSTNAETENKNKQKGKTHTHTYTRTYPPKKNVNDIQEWHVNVSK